MVSHQCLFSPAGNTQMICIWFVLREFSSPRFPNTAWPGPVWYAESEDMNNTVTPYDVKHGQLQKLLMLDKASAYIN